MSQAKSTGPLLQRHSLKLWLVKNWQVSSCGKFMQHLETCLPIAELDRVLCHLVMFLTVFSTSCTKWNTAAFKILLLFMAGLFIGFLVEKCAACQSHWKSDFGWNRVHLAWCIRGLKSLKRFWPFLMPFWGSISTGKPEYLFNFMFVVFSGFMTSSVIHAAMHVCKIWDNGSDLVSGLTSLQVPVVQTMDSAIHRINRLSNLILGR